ncbi:MAG: radical SAM family heme chaperone HemW [Candidatus Margulisiibacteriota bacterium]
MTALYVHIPFCKRKCNYCDFVSYAGKEALIDAYVNALVRELGTKELGTGGPETIFFGGGTPTLLEPRHFEQIIKTVAAVFRPPSRNGDLKVAATSEITIEANPGTADKAKLKALRALGINRLSIGVQSFNDRHLTMLGRVHDSATAKRFYQDARAAGFENINLDLIFALPGQTLAEWKADLRQALELDPEHLSVYNLQIEEGTPFAGKFTKADEEVELAMYEAAIDTLTAAGYKHYEISNFAKPGRECQHNLVYWRNGNYLGVGAGAHSHVNGQRWSNPNCLEEYLSRVASHELRVSDPETRDPRPETIFLGLRLLDGLAQEHFNGFEREVKELIADGLLTADGSNYKLTRKGLYLGNLVFAKFV